MAKARGGFGIAQTVESIPKKQGRVVVNTQSILQLLETKQRRDIEDKVDNA